MGDMGKRTTNDVAMNVDTIIAWPAQSLEQNYLERKGLLI